MSFPYKERHRKESTMSGVLKTPDYSKIEPIPEFRDKIKQESRRLH